MKTLEELKNEFDLKVKKINELKQHITNTNAEIENEVAQANKLLGKIEILEEYASNKSSEPKQ